MSNDNGNGSRYDDSIRGMYSGGNKRIIQLLVLAIIVAYALTTRCSPQTSRDSNRALSINTAITLFGDASVENNQNTTDKADTSTPPPKKSLADIVMGR